MNISEIAEMAGVSRAAVSRYLNHGYVSAEKKEKIRAVIQRTGYQPSVQARMLRTRHSHLIGVLMPRIQTGPETRMLAGVSRVLYENGYQLLLSSTDGQPSRELECLRIFQNNLVEGMILVGTALTDSHRKALDRMMVPAVVTGQRTDRLSCVYHDDYKAAGEMTGLLLKRGRRRLGMLCASDAREPAETQRRSGFLDTVESWGDGVEAFTEACGDSVQEGWEAAGRLLEAHPDLDGLFCATDVMAAGAMEYIRSVGKEIPRDVSVTGIGDSELNQVMTPRLTTAHYYDETSGAEAAGVLLSMIKDRSAPVKSIQLAYHVVEQGSV